MLSVSIGAGSSAKGFCCVSVGDGVNTIGAFQVKVGSSLTVPSDITVENIETLIVQLKDMNEQYQAMTAQKFAPADFGKRAAIAVASAIRGLEQKRDALRPVQLDSTGLDSPVDGVLVEVSDTSSSEDIPKEKNEA